MSYENLQKQEAFRLSNDLDEVPTGECEAGAHATDDPEGVCKACRAQGWKPGDLNR